jgi:hypothetical protein
MIKPLTCAHTLHAARMRYAIHRTDDPARTHVPLERRACVRTPQEES